MPEELQQASTGSANLIFANDASGTEFRLTENAVYSAAEVRDEIESGDDGPPMFGRWLPVTTSEGDGWLSAPGELIEELQGLEAEQGRVYEVTRCVKSGNKQADPYEVNIAEVKNAAQDRL